MLIAKLNDDCLMSIFERLSLNDRLTVSLVCQRWSALARDNFQHQTSLKIVADRKHLDEYLANKDGLHLIRLCEHFNRSNDILILPSIDFFTSRLIMEKFPNLSMLLIFGCQVNSRSIQILLEHWCTSLECLSLIYLENLEPSNRLISCIETKLLNLRHFSYNGTCDMLKNIQLISRLEHLHSTYKPKIFDCLESLSNRTSRLSVNLTETMPTSFRAMSNQNVNFKSLTHLALSSNSMPKSEIVPFLPKIFINLVYLNLSFPSSIQLTLVQSLTLQLNSLVELHLQVDPGECVSIKHQEEAYPSNDRLTTLYLDVDLEPDTIPRLQWTFPNLQAFSLNVSRICCVCPDVPELIFPPLGNLPQAPQFQPPGNEQPDEQAAPLPPPFLQPPPELEIVEDNCENCCERVMKSIDAWLHLRNLTILGPRCKEAAIRALSPHLETISFQTCGQYSLRLLIDVTFNLANAHPSQFFNLLLGASKYKLINRLPTKPVNLRIINVDPLVTFDEE